jgi:hypothetical protein
MTTSVQPYLISVLGSAAVELPELEAAAASYVGVVSVDVMRERLLRGMLLEALTRTECNYSRTAALLGVRRQAVQQMVTRFDLHDWVNALKAQHTRRVA